MTPEQICIINLVIREWKDTDTLGTIIFQFTRAHKYLRFAFFFTTRRRGASRQPSVEKMMINVFVIKEIHIFVATFCTCVENAESEYGRHRMSYFECI